MATIRKKLECDICYEKSSRHIQCLKCTFMACVNCYQRYATDNMSLPSCMKCKYTWEYGEVLKLFPVKFIKEFNKIREEVLFNLNMSLLPRYTETYLEKYKMFKTIRKIPYMGQHTRNKILKRIPDYTQYEVDNEETRTIIKNFKDVLEKLQIKYKGDICAYDFSPIPSFNRVFETSLQKYYYVGTEKLFKCYCAALAICTGDSFCDIFPCNPKSLGVVKTTINKKCKNCNGFLNYSGKCLSCCIEYCDVCEEVRNEEHECDPDVVKTVKLLHKDSVECPKCQVYIYKIEGCNQMWCVKCNTPFDWKTKKILDIKNFHNPHYIEFVKSGKQVPVQTDFICEENPQPLLDLIQQVSGLYITENIFTRLHELHTHLKNLFRDLDPKIIRTGLEYLNNEITLANYKTKLQKYDKTKNLYQEIKELNEIFILQSTEACYTYVQDEDKLIYALNVIIRENNMYRDEVSTKYNRLVGFIIHIKPREYTQFSFGGTFGKTHYFFELPNCIKSFPCENCGMLLKKYSDFKKHLNTHGKVIEYLDEFAIVQCIRKSDNEITYLI